MRPAQGALKVAVFASGRGSNLQALLRAAAAGQLGADIALTVTDRPGAPALAHARHAGVEAIELLPEGFAARADYFRALGDLVADREIGLICLAGYMRLLPPEFVRRFFGRIMNIHPSLLPAFPGLHAPAQALAHGVKISGCTVHFVDEGMDSGPIILQAAVPVLPDDTADSLAARILAEEHRIYPEAVRLFAQGRLAIEGRRVRIEGTGAISPSQGAEEPNGEGMPGDTDPQGASERS